MAITIPTTLTGATMTTFTSPTYTTVAGTYPAPNGKLNYVSAVGGTQTGVRVHSVSDPFTVAVYAPLVPRTLGAMNSNGIYANVPMNVYGIVSRKGLIPAASQPAIVGGIDSKLRIPAGADGYDSANIRALCCAHAAAWWQLASTFADTGISGQL